jgi:hypothetical protein
MEVKVIKERDVGNGESSFKIEFNYTKEDLCKVVTETPRSLETDKK